MDKIQQSIFIQAPKEQVWHTMLSDVTYCEWTEKFSKGSHYVGDWSQDSKMLFLGAADNGESGMVSRVAINRLYEFISIEHLGLIAGGVEDRTSVEARTWAPAFENYRFIERDGGTELIIDQDIAPEHKEEFEQKWVEALNVLKTLVEEGVVTG